MDENFKPKKKVLLKAWRLMCEARAMSDLFEENKEVTSKYVHATSMGHEAAQLALGMQLGPQDYVSPYYRDDSILLGIGMRPYDLMLQLLAKRDDPFSGGRLYYSHPSLNDPDKTKIPYQSSATGMQAIPSTGLAMGVQYRELQDLPNKGSSDSVVVCSIGDAAITEGEVSEAFHMAALKQLPILYFVQDNEWDISASADEIRLQDASEYARGFKGIEIRRVDGSDFIETYSALHEILDIIREQRRPFLLHVDVPLLGHHTSGVRKEWYRDDLEEHQKRDPFPKFRNQLLKLDIDEEDLSRIQQEAAEHVRRDYEEALKADDPIPQDLFNHTFAPTEITKETGEREPAGKDKTVMVDCALFAVREILEKHPEALLYGQDVGGRLGGVFREAATLARDFGDHRVFNTPIQEAFIIGSTAGMSVAGCKPIVEVQFADYIFPGVNQLFTEVARSYYLSNGKWPTSSVIRVPIGAYGSGGPFHSSSVESIIVNIKGIKVVYPSNGADLKGLMKAAFYDPNPVVIFEHKGLYWSKVKGTEYAMSIEPDENYRVPIGKGRIVQYADNDLVKSGDSLVIVTYGMGVHWALNASKKLKDHVEIVDLRSLAPFDEDLIIERVKLHGKCLLITEESRGQSFTPALAGFIQRTCFEYLDAPIGLVASENVPAIPMNSTLEATMLPNAEKVKEEIERLLAY